MFVLHDSIKVDVFSQYQFIMMNPRQSHTNVTQSVSFVNSLVLKDNGFKKFSLNFTLNPAIENEPHLMCDQMTNNCSQNKQANTKKAHNLLSEPHRLHHFKIVHVQSLHFPGHSSQSGASQLFVADWLQ